MAPETPDPQPSDPPFLVAILLAARRARDAELESLARDWLAERGIRVVLEDDEDRAVEPEAR